MARNSWPEHWLHVVTAGIWPTTIGLTPYCATLSHRKMAVAWTDCIRFLQYYIYIYTGPWDHLDRQTKTPLKAQLCAHLRLADFLETSRWSPLPHCLWRWTGHPPPAARQDLVGRECRERVRTLPGRKGLWWFMHHVGWCKSNLQLDSWFIYIC